MRDNEGTMGWPSNAKRKNTPTFKVLLEYKYIYIKKKKPTQK